MAGPRDLQSRSALRASAEPIDLGIFNEVCDLLNLPPSEQSPD